MRVSNSLRRAFPDVDLARIDASLADYAARQVSVVDFPDSKPKRSLGWNGTLFMQSVLQRSKALYLGAICGWNVRNASSAMLCIRGHLEATAGLGHFYRYLRRFYDGKISFEELDQMLFRKSLGVRDENWKVKEFSVPEAVGVMSQMDALDGEWKEIASEGRPIFRAMYESVSEFCHLNFGGLTLHREIRDDSGASFDTNLVLRKEVLSLGVGVLSPSIIIFFLLYDRAWKLLQENEEIPVTH